MTDGHEDPGFLLLFGGMSGYKPPHAMNLLQKIQREGLRKDLPDFKAGDTVRVHTKIKEGDKERIQVFEGTVLRSKGQGREATFTVRKVSYGVGVERIFPLYSPTIDRIEIVVRGQVRRARLYYLRQLSGKKARVKGHEGESAGSDPVPVGSKEG